MAWSKLGDPCALLCRLCPLRPGEPFASDPLNPRWLNPPWIPLVVALIALWIARFFGAFGGPVPV